MSLPTLVLVSCVFCAGAILQSFSGFGFAMIVAPLIGLVAPELIPGPVLALTLLLTLSYSLKSLPQVNWRDVALILCGRLPFTVLAALAVSYLHPDWISLFFGLVLLASIGVTYRKVRVQTTPVVLVTAGAASGFFGTITSVAAPPLAIAYQNGNPEVVRATLGVNIIIGTAFSLASLSSYGLIDWPALATQCGLGLPAVLAGSWVGSQLVRRVPGKDFRGIVLALAATASLALVLRAGMRILG